MTSAINNMLASAIHVSGQGCYPKQKTGGGGYYVYTGCKRMHSTEGTGSIVVVKGCSG